MNIDLAALPDDVDTLQRMVRTLAAERVNLTAAQAEIERLRLIVQKLQRNQFGRRAEQLDDDQLQLGFEDLNADIARVEATLPSTAAPARSRANPESSQIVDSQSRSVRPSDSVGLVKLHATWRMRQIDACVAQDQSGQKN